MILSRNINNIVLLKSVLMKIVKKNVELKPCYLKRNIELMMSQAGQIRKKQKLGMLEVKDITSDEQILKI